MKHHRSLLRFVAGGLAGAALLVACSEGPTPSRSGARAGTPDERAALFDSVLAWTEKREAFSPLKEAALDFRPLQSMAALRDDVVGADTEEALYYALVRLSNARRDHHLAVAPVTGGLRPPRGPVLRAPVRVLSDFSDLDGITFFVSSVDLDAPDAAHAGGWARTGAAPEPGDRVLSADGRTVPELIEALEPYIAYSSRHGRLWDLATVLTRRDPAAVPPWLQDVDTGLELTLERPAGETYSTTLPWLEEADVRLPFSDSPLYPGFTTVLARQNFEVLLPDDGRALVLLRWLDFEDELVQDVADLMELAQLQGLLDHALVIDVTDSSGGSGGAYAIQRLVDRPFKTTFGNLRLSDAGVRWAQDRIRRGIDEDAPELFGMDMGGRWLIEWLTTDVADSILAGADYTNAVPFKSAHLPKDSDGVLQPAPVHFRGPVAILAGPRGGSHLDQFVSMFADNGLARTVGMPTGGYSNTWEATELLEFPAGPGGAPQPVVAFMWNIGHTFRPNGEILEGNPVMPELYIPLTRENFRTYHMELLNEALTLIGARPLA